MCSTQQFFLESQFHSFFYTAIDFCSPYSTKKYEGTICHLQDGYCLKKQKTIWRLGWCNPLYLVSSFLIWELNQSNWRTDYIRLSKLSSRDWWNASAVSFLAIDREMSFTWSWKLKLCCQFSLLYQFHVFQATVRVYSSIWAGLNLSSSISWSNPIGPYIGIFVQYEDNFVLHFQNSRQPK